MHATSAPALRGVGAVVIIAAEAETPMRQLVTSIQRRGGPVPANLPDLDAIRDAARALVGGRVVGTGAGIDVDDRSCDRPEAVARR